MLIIIITIIIVVIIITMFKEALVALITITLILLTKNILSYYIANLYLNCLLKITNFCKFLEIVNVEWNMI